MALCRSLCAYYRAEEFDRRPMAAPDTVVRLDEKFDMINDHWRPRVVGQVNNLDVKIVKVQGEFVWHVHEDTDEFFLVRSGRLTIQLRDRADVVLDAGDLFIVPKGVEHCPSADVECEVVLLEPTGVVNTGSGDNNARTAPTDEWI